MKVNNFKTPIENIFFRSSKIGLIAGGLLKNDLTDLMREEKESLEAKLKEYQGITDLQKIQLKFWNKQKRKGIKLTPRNEAIRKRYTKQLTTFKTLTKKQQKRLDDYEYREGAEPELSVGAKSYIKEVWLWYEKGFKVLMTRTSDSFVPLQERSNIANDFKADLFISIHANASRHKRQQGFEIYFMSENASDPWAAEVADYENSAMRFEDEENAPDPAALLLHSLARNEYMNEGSKLSGLVVKEFSKRTPFVNRGVKQAAFYVLRGTYAPGILVEMGFMTNRKDQTNLCKLSVRKKIADSIYRGIKEYAKMNNWK